MSFGAKPWESQPPDSVDFPGAAAWINGYRARWRKSAAAAASYVGSPAKVTGKAGRSLNYLETQVVNLDYASNGGPLPVVPVEATLIAIASPLTTTDTTDPTVVSVNSNLTTSTLFHLRYDTSGQRFWFQGRDNGENTFFNLYQSGTSALGGTHVVIGTYRSGLQRIYVNGLHLGSDAVSFSTSWLFDFNRVCFGALDRGSGPALSFEGQIAFAGVYPRQFTHAECAQLRTPRDVWRRLAAPMPPRRIWVPSAGGPGVYDVAVSESGTLADFVSSLGVFGSALTGIGAAAESVSSQHELVAASSELAVALSAEQAAASILIAAAESANGADTASAASTAAGAVQETDVASDAASAVTAAFASATAAGAANDAVSVLMSALAAVAETAVASDAVSSGSATVEVTVEDSATPAEVLSAVLSAAAAAVEAATAGTAQSASVAAQRSQAEAAAAAAVVDFAGTAHVLELVEPADALSALSALLAATSSAAGSTSAGDVVSTAVVWSAASTNSAAAAEALLATWSGTRSLLEATAGSDLFTAFDGSSPGSVFYAVVVQGLRPGVAVQGLRLGVSAYWFNKAVTVSRS